MSSCSSYGQLKPTTELQCTTIAGPLCFSGDVIAARTQLPPIGPGDWVSVLDTGANTLSLFSRHCSRLAPAVVGFANATGAGSKGESAFVMACLKPKETTAQALSFWE